MRPKPLPWLVAVALVCAIAGKVDNPIMKAKSLVYEAVTSAPYLWIAHGVSYRSFGTRGCSAGVTTLSRRGRCEHDHHF